MAALRQRAHTESPVRRTLTLVADLAKSYFNDMAAADFACCPAPDAGADLRPVEGADADEELAALAKAIAHPARVHILRILVRRTACICGDIVEELSLAQSTVSQHLKVLKEAGLIRGDIDGPRVCYCIEPRALRRLRALVGGL